MPSDKPSRVTNVQVPGEPAKAVADSAERPSDEVLQDRVAAINTPSAVDMEAMRAQIREEERAILRDELSVQMQAASKAIEGTVGNAAAPRHKRDYRNMRAADIDPATLTAPVMTLDGYLCPPAPEAKK